MIADTLTPAGPDTKRELLRLTLATLAYRAAKAVRGASENFAALRIGEHTRTPAQILAHMGDLLDWGLQLAKGVHVWQDSEPLPWNQEVGRFFRAAESLDAYLASDAPLGWSAERIFQGPIADSLTHVGQLTMLRRLAGSPVLGENYARAEIAVGQVGARQPAPNVEFD